MIPPKGSIPHRTRGNPNRNFEMLRRRDFEVPQGKWEPHTLAKKPTKAIPHSLKAILDMKLSELADCIRLLAEGGLGTFENGVLRHADTLKADIERIQKGG